jgi:N-terminal domain of anti-restriction factor ArdC
MGEQTRIDWQRLIDTALTAPGSTGNVYNRFYEYSFGNRMLLLMQGVYEPVATYDRWHAIGRHVIRGARAREIIRPIFVEVDPTLDDPEEQKEKVARLIGFKAVRAVFPMSETFGPEPPPIEYPKWDVATALAKLSIRRVPFVHPNGNVQGYAVNRDIAINPLAVQPERTLMHELGHVMLGHTLATSLSEYGQHRGVMEAQAELTAYLVLNELGMMTDELASHARGYSQHWLNGERLSDRAIQLIFAVTDQILKAGRVTQDATQESQSATQENRL